MPSMSLVDKVVMKGLNLRLSCCKHDTLTTELITNNETKSLLNEINGTKWGH